MEETLLDVLRLQSDMDGDNDEAGLPNDDDEDLVDDEEDENETGDDDGIME